MHVSVPVPCGKGPSASSQCELGSSMWWIYVVDRVDRPAPAAAARLEAVVGQPAAPADVREDDILRRSTLAVDGRRLRRLERRAQVAVVDERVVVRLAEEARRRALRRGAPPRRRLLRRLPHVRQPLAAADEDDVALAPRFFRHARLRRRRWRAPKVRVAEDEFGAHARVAHAAPPRKLAEQRAPRRVRRTRNRSDENDRAVRSRRRCRRQQRARAEQPLSRCLLSRQLRLARRNLQDVSLQRRKNFALARR